MHAAKPDQIGAERQRLDDIGAAVDRAVDDDHGAACHRLHYFRQHVGRAAAVIELTAAVIGDVDDLHPMIERDLGVLGGADAFDRERYLELAFHAFDRAPIERHLEVAALHAAASGGDVPLGEVALAPAVMRGVDRDAKRRVFVFDRAFDVVVGPSGVATDVELEHAQRVGRRLGNLFEARIAHRAEHVRDAKLGRRPGHRFGAARIKAFQRTNRAEHDGQPQFAAEHFDRRVDLADVAQHPRAKRNCIERHAIAPQRRFRLGAADDIVPIVLIEIGARFADDFMQGVKLARRGGIDGGTCFIGILAGHVSARHGADLAHG